MRTKYAKWGYQEHHFCFFFFFIFTFWRGTLAPSSEEMLLGVQRTWFRSKQLETTIFLYFLHEAFYFSFLRFCQTYAIKKMGTFFVDPSPYTINLLIAYDENTLLITFFVIGVSPLPATAAKAYAIQLGKGVLAVPCLLKFAKQKQKQKNKNNNNNKRRDAGEKKKHHLSIKNV